MSIVHSRAWTPLSRPHGIIAARGRSREPGRRELNLRRDGQSSAGKRLMLLEQREAEPKAAYEYGPRRAKCFLCPH